MSARSGVRMSRKEAKSMRMREAEERAETWIHLILVASVPFLASVWLDCAVTLACASERFLFASGSACCFSPLRVACSGTGSCFASSFSFSFSVSPNSVLRYSSTFCGSVRRLQFLPSYPSAQMHFPSVLLHIPCPEQGFAAPPTHSIEQFSPAQPLWQSQVPLWLQTPCLAQLSGHGFGGGRSLKLKMTATRSSQNWPVKPDVQLQSQAGRRQTPCPLHLLCEHLSAHSPLGRMLSIRSGISLATSTGSAATDTFGIKLLMLMSKLSVLFVSLLSNWTPTLL
eukprot:1321911-Rhodomonas_salina.4